MKLKVLFDEQKENYRLSGETHDERCTKLNLFLESLELKGLAQYTVRAYAYDLVLILRFLEERKIEIKNMREHDLVDFVAFQKRRDAKPRSINRRLSTCRSIYSFITGNNLSGGQEVNRPVAFFKGQGRDKILGIHVLEKKKYLALQVKVPKKLVAPLKPEDVKLFIRHLRRYRDLTIVHLMLLSGLRSQEVLSLCLDDVDFFQNWMRVCGKGNKDRFLPLNKIVRDVLRSYLRFERPNFCSTQSLFVVLQGKKRGSPMTPAGLRSLFRHWRKKLQLEQANPHRFRHTFGTDMARAGVPLAVLQKLMGHASSDTTLQYINLSMSDSNLGKF